MKSPQKVLLPGSPFVSSFNVGKFTDNLELEASRGNVHLRYSRDANATDFESYLAFLQSADLGNALEALRPLIESIAADSSTSPLGTIAQPRNA